MTAQTLAEFHKAHPPDPVGQNKGHIWEGGQTSIKVIWGAPFCPFIQGGVTEPQAQSLSPHLLSRLHIWEGVRIRQGEANLGNRASSAGFSNTY